MMSKSEKAAPHAGLVAPRFRARNVCMITLR